jgi:hypothetical protein
MAGRPAGKIGAHTTGKNSISYGVSMVANCAKSGTYDSTPTSTNPYATTAQKESLVNLLVYLLFKSRIFLAMHGQNLHPGGTHTGQLKIFFPDDTEQVHKAADTNPIPISYLKKVIYGHNQFASKRCPCFKVPSALDGNFGTELQNKIMEYMSDAVMFSQQVGVEHVKIDAKGNPLGGGGTALEAEIYYDSHGTTYYPYIDGWEGGPHSGRKPTIYKDGDFTWSNRRDIT